MSDRRTAPVSVVVLTWNEERNLEPCLASVAGWTEQIFVVDSGSTDATLGIARDFGAAIVAHPFDSHARQWRWALDELPIRSPWVLALDADQRVTVELRDAIIDALGRPAGPDTPDGYFVNRRQVFRGRWIRHGGYYPKWLLKLFRRGAAVIDDGDLVDHHFRVPGRTARLQGDLVEDNRNETRISDWIEKHNRYAQRQAREELARPGAGGRARLLGNPDERTTWLKRRWIRLPLYVRPFGYFAYRYVVRLGFLDGKEGFVFHFMQALWYRLLVDINRDELTGEQAAGTTAAPDVPAATAPARSGRSET
jgi:glycosyltransferase involved in cell wall biosynthesis